MSRTRTSLTAMTCALACVVTGALLAAGPASAASRGFKIYNNGTHTLQLKSVGKLLDWKGAAYIIDFDEGRPPDAALLKPGTFHDWELKYNFLQDFGATLVYSIQGSTEVATITVFTTQTHNDSTCSIPSSLGRCSAEGLTLTVTDPAKTVRSVPASDARAQADTLRELCTPANAATCDFTPTAEEQTTAAAHLVGSAAVNCQQSAVEKTVSYQDTITESNSMGVEPGSSVEGNVLSARAKAAVSSKYDREWTSAKTWRQDLTFAVEPGHMAWVASTAPIYRDTGDLVIRLGTTTRTLRNISFDTPDPSRDAVFAPASRALSAAEYKARCTDPPPGQTGLASAPASWVTMHRSGSGDHERMVGGPESDRLLGLGGNDTLLGAGGHDSLFGGPGKDRLRGGPGDDVLHGDAGPDTLDGDTGNDALEGGSGADALNGGPGRDILDGGPGADTMVDTSGPTRVRTGSDTGPGRDVVDVRDGRGDDVVSCGTRRTLVVADPGDRVGDRCGTVVRRGPTPPIAG